MNFALQRCGFDATTVRYLIAQGFATPNDLRLASEADLDLIARSISRTPPRGAGNVTMPFMAVKNLKGFCFWADERMRTGFDTNPDNFTADDVPIFTAKCQEYLEQKEAAKDEDPSKPDSLKKLVNWSIWNESFQNYLRQILSAAKIPLVYLTREERETPVVLDPADFGSPTEFLIEATILEGRHYELDNPRFYRELKTFVVNGEGWSYIKKYERSQDGRRAYLALKTQCEGTASKITRKNKAYASIANATYSGSRRQYKFQDFINVHQTAHNEILDCDPSEAVPESKKVADFLKGITDPKLESAVSNGVRKSGDKSDKVEKGGKLPKGFKLENKWYPPKIFRLLSQEQKNQLKEWGEKKGKRTVAALKKQIKDELKSEMKGKGKDDDDEDDNESSADEAAGKEFGRGAHKKKQKKDKA
ncbi:hypothetical protein MHU86_23271 [Fragilaria crotonensis]|nr:hypothetical protein MHU86_23271 [Fragilaria crotonensis]